MSLPGGMVGYVVCVRIDSVTSVSYITANVLIVYSKRFELLSWSAYKSILVITYVHVLGKYQDVDQNKLSNR